jgi:hypothetical protein
MSDFSVRSDNVDVEQIMRQIRARIREKRGVDYTEEEIRELANVKLEKFIDPKGVRSDLLQQYRDAREAALPPNYKFEDTTLFETHRGFLAFMRRLLHPILKLFFNPNPLIEALHIQSKLNDARAAMEPLQYELMHNLVIELTRTSIEVKSLKMRLESMASRLDFDERRARALEGVVQYRPGAVPPLQPPTGQDQGRRDRDRDRDQGRRDHGRREGRGDQGPRERDRDRDRGPREPAQPPLREAGQSQVRETGQPQGHEAGQPPVREPGQPQGHEAGQPAPARDAVLPQPPREGQEANALDNDGNERRSRRRRRRGRRRGGSGAGGEGSSSAFAGPQSVGQSASAGGESSASFGETAPDDEPESGADYGETAPAEKAGDSGAGRGAPAPDLGPPSQHQAAAAATVSPAAGEPAPSVEPRTSSLEPPSEPAPPRDSTES